MINYEIITDELNALIKTGHLVTTQKGLFGARGAALSDGSAEIRDISAMPQGRAGAIFYLVNGYELISNGKVVARWAYGPGNAELQTRACFRARHWLLLKARAA